MVRILQNALALAMVGLMLMLPSQAALSPPYGDRRGVNYNWKWRSGRATWFGGSDGWSIHNGSCNYQYIYPDEPLGWDVAALTDVISEYPDSCGLCYEVACDSTWTSDNYGSSFDRTASCYDTDASLVVRIVDVCPCQYPSNAYNNKRWCCGDRDHLDMSIWAFEKLAETRWGVIPIRYRPVPCDYKPSKKAKSISNPTPAVKPPAGDVRRTRDWPEYFPDSSNTRLSVFEDGYASGIVDNSWKMQLQSLADSSKSGAAGSQAVCGKVPIGGALAFRGWNGMFSKRKALEFWFYVGATGWDGKDQKTPDLWVSVSGKKGGCKPSRVIDSKPIYYEPMWKPYAQTYYWGWQIYLPVFNGWKVNSVINKYSDFTGCGGNSVWDLDTIEFRNDGWAEQWACVDRVRLI
ncbi:hypothetical protein Agub_g11554 [Astrephomene gubernaculifera]|uniref:Expansin-like EG45 domain-containing protein n=1 Tax=Astrephomene gubernaculifera TaxID=47775 RepID=A0AAD3DX66_9CHLO|nr:hypothetical protein Agub_g11554 [Astrephomene gubernaculifera]